MSTRAFYSFFPGSPREYTWNVYKHHDGYPSGAAATLRSTIDHFAWPLPRYESDEFAAAFCAAAKANYYLEAATAKTAKERKDAQSYMQYRGGGARFMPQGEACEIAQRECSDIGYRYEIMMGTGGKKLIIRAFHVNYWTAPGKEHCIFYGPFEDFERAAEELNKLPFGYSIYKSGGRRERIAPIVEHVSTGKVA